MNKLFSYIGFLYFHYFNGNSHIRWRYENYLRLTTQQTQIRHIKEAFQAIDSKPDKITYIKSLIK